MFLLLEGGGGRNTPSCLMSYTNWDKFQQVWVTWVEALPLNTLYGALCTTKFLSLVQKEMYAKYKEN